MIEWWAAGLVLICLIPAEIILIGYIYGVFEDYLSQEPAQEES